MHIWSLPIGFAVNGLLNLWAARGNGNNRNFNGVVQAFADPNFVLVSAGIDMATKPFSSGWRPVFKGTVSVANIVEPEIRIPFGPKYCQELATIPVFSKDIQVWTRPETTCKVPDGYFDVVYYAGEGCAVFSADIDDADFYSECPMPSTRTRTRNTAKVLHNTVKFFILIARNIFLSISNWSEATRPDFNVCGLLSLFALPRIAVETYSQLHAVSMWTAGLALLICALLSWAGISIYGNREHILRAVVRASHVVGNAAASELTDARFVFCEVSRSSRTICLSWTRSDASFPNSFLGVWPTSSIGISSSSRTRSSQSRTRFTRFCSLSGSQSP